MNVLQICHDAKGPFVDICRQYAGAFPRDRVTTVYLCGANDQTVAHETGGDQVLFFELNSSSLRGLKWTALTRLAAVMHEGKFDVVIAHRYKCIYLAGVLSYLYRPRVLLGVVHEHKVFQRPTRSLFVRLWCRHLRLVAVSNSVARDIERFCGALPERLFTMHHAVREDLVDALLHRKEARTALELSVSGLALVCIGRLVNKKNHRLLLDALHQVPDDIHLSIIGDGPLRSSLEAQVEQLGLSERVVFHGHKPSASRYLKAFDGLVLASGHEEAFGMVLLEGSAAELPVLCSNVGGPSELGIADLLFESGNASSLAAEIMKLKHVIPQSADERLRNFTPDVFARRMSEVMNSVIIG